VLRAIRRRMMRRLPLVGAGATPLPRPVLAGHTVWPFYPSSLTRAEIDAAMLGRAFEADRNPVRIVWIGRLVAIKRVDRLINAAAGFARSWQGAVELHLFGDGPLRQELESLASGTGSSLRTVFHGRVPGVGLVARLHGALCLALTSAWEGFPKVVPEALSAGIPIVAFDIGSVSSLIDSRDVGIVVRGGEPAMASAFQALAASPETWRAKSANARAAALDLALDDQCQRLLQHLQASAA
jgi:glycosyltransferase involved in cell wall biosynthesis